MKNSSRSIAALVVLAALSAGCSTNTQGDDPSPVYLTCNFTLLPALKCVNDGSLLQFQTSTLNSFLKGSATAGTSGFTDTQVESYTIVWTRVDGGKTASGTETFGANVIVPGGGQTSLQNYPFMSISALQKPPLDQLFPYNGGIDRETGNTEIRQTGTVTWYGHTMSGQPVSSVPAVFNMTFQYCPAAGRIETSRGR
jgi:hypothetical protein